MASKTTRVVLNFEDAVHRNEKKLWYVLNYELTPLVKDVINEVATHLNSPESWMMYVNDILAPNWLPSSVICSENDFVKLIQCKAVNTAESRSPESMDTFNKSSTIENSLTTSLKHTSPENKDDQKVSTLKISNNFKRKFSDTTPIHKDRYTNRSKIYISPGLPKSIPIANALKTAVKETVTYSSPLINKSLKDKSLQCQTVTDSFHKTRTFHDKVTTLLSKNNLAVQENSNSDSNSSMTSSSSDGKSFEQLPKKIKTTHAVCSIESPSSAGKLLKKPQPSSSDDSDSQHEASQKSAVISSGNQSDGKLLKKQIDSSSDDSDLDHYQYHWLIIVYGSGRKNNSLFLYLYSSFFACLHV